MKDLKTRTFDLVLYINRLPLVVGEVKTPVRDAISWQDGIAGWPRSMSRLNLSADWALCFGNPLVRKPSS